MTAQPPVITRVWQRWFPRMMVMSLACSHRGWVSQHWGNAMNSAGLGDKCGRIVWCFVWGDHTALPLYGEGVSCQSPAMSSTLNKTPYLLGWPVALGVVVSSLVQLIAQPRLWAVRTCLCRPVLVVWCDGAKGKQVRHTRGVAQKSFSSCNSWGASAMEPA